MNNNHTVSLEENPNLYCIQSLANLSVDDEPTILNDGVFYSKLNVLVKPQVRVVESKQVLIIFHLSNPHWDRSIVESCSGIGEDLNTAFGMAMGSFIFGVLQGVRMMLTEKKPNYVVESKFVDKTHKWDLYLSDVVGMGKGAAKIDSFTFWNLLKDEILKRVGNQKFCYVKVYGAKYTSGSIGECRINDIPIIELGESVKALVDTWGKTEFNSQKQFFFLCQNEEVAKPLPYNESQLIERVKKGTAAFRQCWDGTKFNPNYRTLIANEVGDVCLAEEIYSFLPEMCAENFYRDLQLDDEIVIKFNGKSHAVYKSQIASYYPIMTVLYEEFEKGLYSDNDIFGALVSISSVYGLVCELNQKGIEIGKINSKVRMNFNFSNQYQLR